jgi:predicted permease
VTICNRSDAESEGQFSYPDYQYLRQNNHVFLDIAGVPNSIGVSSDFNFDGRSVTVVTRPVSENYFAVLSLRPFLGRFFSSGDDRNPAKVAVMTYSCWKRLGSDRQIVGKIIAGQTVVGVTPEEFAGAFYGFEGDLFTSIGQDAGPWQSDRTARRMPLIARLKPAVSRRQAQAELSALTSQLASAFPREDKGLTAVLTRATLLPPGSTSDAEWMIAVLLALVLLVLLIACANVANLLLAVAVGRRQEAAIKLALGAPRGRLIREFLVESGVLCFAGGVLGYGIAAVVIRNFSRVTIVLPQIGPFSFGIHLRLDATVALLSILLTLIASLATGLAPALYASSPALAQILGGEIVVGGTRKRARRNTLVVVQVAVCTLVLVGMGLCQRNLYNLRHVDLGFSERNLISEIVYSEAEGYTKPRRAEFHEKVRGTVAAIPGIESVGFTADLPLLGAEAVPVQVPDGAATVRIHHNVVDSGYFDTLGIRILTGRAFNSTDRPDSPPVAVVNHKLAETFWPGQNPIGKVMVAGEASQKLQVIGVARDGPYLDLDEAPKPFFYYALSQHDVVAVNVVARTKGDPRLWAAPLDKALRGLDLKIQIHPETFENWISLSLITQRIAAGFVGILSGLGLLLAVIGLFGAISYSVSARKKELGIRVALGAVPWQLLQLILRETLLVAGTGVVIGTLLGVAATVVFRSQMYGIRAVEWTVILPVGVAMLALSLTVAALSARPSLTVDPMESVRHA